jgi:hypothetical protein
MPDDTRVERDDSTAPICTTAEGAMVSLLDRDPFARDERSTSSASVFHSPHASQRPCHLRKSAPHSVQRYTVRDLTVTMLAGS